MRIKNLEACALPRWEICQRNPVVGAGLENVTKQSLELSIARQRLRGTVRLNEPSSRLPDIRVDLHLPHKTVLFSVDCKHWTATQARGGRIYLSREFYGSQRGEPTLRRFLEDTTRFLFIAFELPIVDKKTGKHYRRLFFVPGGWLWEQFRHLTGVPAIKLTDWPSFGKDGGRLYNIDLYQLIDMVDNWRGTA